MPLYIPWLTETIKKRGVRYLLHHYLGQFFEEKLTLEQLSIDIYEGRGSIRDLALDVNGLNDELDFVPFKFLDGCSIGQISVEVPWSSLATDACKVELDGAKFICRLKTSSDASKTHCTESTLLSRSLMTSSMQMAEEIVTTEDDECDSQTDSVYQPERDRTASEAKKKDANQMFEGLEMFAQLIDSVLRRTKLTARDTLFQIQPHCESQDGSSGSDADSTKTTSSNTRSNSDSSEKKIDNSEDTVEFLIKFFRCEEIMDQKSNDFDGKFNRADMENGSSETSPHALPETVTKLLTLEDVEMRIGGIPVSSLVGKHTIMIKFNGQKSEISIYSGSPLLAVISHQQLKTFFKVFDSAKTSSKETNRSSEKDQEVMSYEDYAKIESQLLESAEQRRGSHHLGESNRIGSGYLSSQSGRRWIDNSEMFSNLGSRSTRESEPLDYHSPNSLQNVPNLNHMADLVEPTLENIEAFSCELKLPGVWICLLRDGEVLPSLIKPYADSINSFETINKYIDERIKVPHIRCLALKVALDLTSNGITVFIGDLDITEHLENNSMKPTINLLKNVSTNTTLSTPRYQAKITNSKDITIELLSGTRIVLDPAIIDRLASEYKLLRCATQDDHSKTTSKQSSYQLDLNLTIKSEQFKVELLCPIPDLRPEAQSKPTQLRPQSFLFEFTNMIIMWQSDKLNLSAKSLAGYVKTQPQQHDEEAVRFLVSHSDNRDRITLSLEPTPSNLDSEFPNDVERALNESSMFDSIYVSQTNESKIVKEAFQTKRKVVRGCMGDQTHSMKTQDSSRLNDCDSERIVAPGDRQHLEDYLSQNMMSTKLSLCIHLPTCEVEFEDKEQLDLIYNRFGNDYVFWQPKAFSSNLNQTDVYDKPVVPEDFDQPSFKRPINDSASDKSDRESEVSFHSFSVDGSNSSVYDNEVTCKVVVEELYVKFNHQSCAAALKQEISAENLLLGFVIDVNKKPGTVISLVADSLELSTDSDTVLEGNHFCERSSTFALTAEIKRPTKALKDIKLAIQVVGGLFDDFKIETYKRFWQSINVTDEPIQGFVAPKIVTELHIDILNTALSLSREGARPALICIDELYLTSMVMEQTSQVMIRLIADEVSLYLKRDRQGLEVLKNYICLVDSGLIDLDVRFSQDGRLEFSVINNVITVRVCQDSLSALCKFFNVLMKSSNGTNDVNKIESMNKTCRDQNNGNDSHELPGAAVLDTAQDELVYDDQYEGRLDQNNDSKIDEALKAAERDLLEDAMNYDYTGGQEKENGGHQANHAEEVLKQANPNACLLDQSNPALANLLSPPLVPCGLMDDLSSSRPIDESGFFVIGDDDVGAGIIDKQQHEPSVRRLTSSPIVIVDNHFKMTKPRTIPEMLAASLERYVLEEMTLVISLYGGRDFDDEISTEKDGSLTPGQESQAMYSDLSSGSTTAAGTAADEIGGSSSRSRTSSFASVQRPGRKHCFSDSSSSQATGPSQATTPGLDKRKSRRKHLSEGSRDLASSESTARVRFGEGAVNLWESLDLMSAGDFLGAKRASQPTLSADSKLAGGARRQMDVCIQLTLTKVKLLYELADSSSPISWRFMLFIHDIEIKDKIQASDINKMLYEYCTESMPRRNTQILTLKNVATINPSDGCEECDLKVSLKPLRLNIDQDTLLFLIDFFSSLGKSLGKQSSSATCQQQQPQQRSRQASQSSTCSQPASRYEAPSGDSTPASDTPIRSDGSSSAAATVAAAAAKAARQQQQLLAADYTVRDNQNETMLTRCHEDKASSKQRSIYVKSFTFSPDVPIRLDYHAKHLDFEQGALAGILMGLAHLDHSELVLRRVQAKHGMRGLDRVFLFVLNSWASDIKRNQLPGILGGVGPMHSVIQLFQGMRDLVWMPIDHYRKDRRLVRGIQRGASSFSSSTAMAAINLMNRFISIVQCTAQIAHDIVTPPGSQRGQFEPAYGQNHHHQAILSQPRNFCEGVAVGFTILKEGFNDTARNVAVGMQADDMRSAVGELVRQIPSTLLSPIISATEGAQNVLVGIRNQIAPDARRDDQEKWKRRVRGK